MKRSLLALGLAAALATGSAGIATAQSTTTTMDVGLTMLELAVGNEFHKLGMADVDLQALTLHQLSQIKAIFEDPDYTNAERADEVRRLLAEK